jgi:hypothetical protein
LIKILETFGFVNLVKIQIGVMEYLFVQDLTILDIDYVESKRMVMERLELLSFKNTYKNHFYTKIENLT